MIGLQYTAKYIKFHSVPGSKVIPYRPFAKRKHITFNLVRTKLRKNKCEYIVNENLIFLFTIRLATANRSRVSICVTKILVRAEDTVDPIKISSLLV